MKSAMIAFVCLSALIYQATCSSIPMWEYLSKDEKMSYLYSTFKNQVEEFCEFSELDNCKEELTRYGLKKLRELPEISLDEMDPYQRGANSIIWNRMTDGHEIMKSTPKQQPSTTTTTPQANTLEDESFGDSSFGNQAVASSKVENVYRLPPPKDFVYPNSAQRQQEPIESYESGTPLYRYPQNKNAIPDDSYQKGQGLYVVVRAPSTTLTPPPLPVTRQETYQDGPIVIKVYPDGTPVKDTQQNVVPQDEDLRQYMLSKVKLPEY